MRIVILVVAFLVAGCAGGSEDADGETPTEPAQDLDEEVREVYIVATDMSYRPQSIWRFYPEEAQGPADTPFNLTFKSAGGNSYPHSLVIDELDIRLEAGAEFESATVRVEAPAGTYTFYCDVENHRELGMEGTLVVA